MKENIFAQNASQYLLQLPVSLSKYNYKRNMLNKNRTGRVPNKAATT